MYYYVYIITNMDNKVLYIGVTNNLIRRISEHKNNIHKGFTAKYNVYKLVYYEYTTDIIAAINREKQLKGWSRIKKYSLLKIRIRIGKIYLLQKSNNILFIMRNEILRLRCAPLRMT